MHWLQASICCFHLFIPLLVGINWLGYDDYENTMAALPSRLSLNFELHNQQLIAYLNIPAVLFSSNQYARDGLSFNQGQASCSCP